GTSVKIRARKAERSTAPATRPAKKNAKEKAREKAKDVARPPAKPAATQRHANEANDANDPLTRLRALCNALPETTEKEAWGTPTFRVRGKMFAMFADDHHGDGRVAVWCKAPTGAQEALVESDPDVFFRPPYVGPSGWVGVRLDRGLPWDE